MIEFAPFAYPAAAVLVTAIFCGTAYLLVDRWLALERTRFEEFSDLATRFTAAEAAIAQLVENQNRLRESVLRHDLRASYQDGLKDG